LLPFGSFLLPFISFYFLLFPFISFYFHESILFNGLRAIEIKKFACPFRFAQKLCFGSFQTAAGLLLARRRPGAWISPIEYCLAHVSDFVKQETALLQR
jgi:hypothetical protein